MSFSSRSIGALMLGGIIAVAVCAPRANADNARKLTIHRALCDIYEKQHNVNAAMSEYAVLIAMSPNDAPTQYACGKFLLDQRDYGTAVRYLKKATQIDGSEAAYWAELGNAYSKMKNIAAAADAYDKGGPACAKSAAAAHQYIQKLKQFNDYNKKVKEQQEQQE